MNQGWQSESNHGPKGGWSCVFGAVAMVAVVTWPVTSPTTAGCVPCNAAVVVVVAEWSCSCWCDQCSAAAVACALVQ